MFSGKKGAIELSIGTIVIIVLSMSMLILGLVLVKSIFSGSISIADMTTEQLKNQVSQMFGEDKKLVIYPDSRMITLKKGKVDGFGIGLKNLIEGSAETAKFSYEVVVSDPDLRRKCGIGDRDAENYISTGRTEDNIPLGPGQITSTKVLFNIPPTAPLCTLRYRVNVKQDNQPYASDIIDVIIKAA